MKSVSKIIHSVRINRVATLALLAVMSLTAGAKQQIVTDIAPYVFPANRASSPSSMTFMPDGESYLAANDDKTRIVRYETKSGKELETVFDVATARETKLGNFEGFSISPTGTYLLIYRASEPVYRRSSRAAYFTYEIAHRVLRPLSTTFDKQQAPLFSPDSRSVAFVADNNIYIKKLDYNTEVAVTTDGEKNRIINGVPDWTYEEEFDTNRSMAWSPDSETFCYLKYNESEVHTYSFPLYQGACNPMNAYALYPGSFDYKYPVAGTQNSKVDLYCYDVANRKNQPVPFEDSKIEYIPRIIYSADKTKLIVATLNREQNRMEIYAVNPKSTVAKSLLVEIHKTWLDPSAYENITLTPTSMFILSSRSGYSHIYEYSLAGALVRQVTSGDYDVTECYGCDAAGSVYYCSTKESPLRRMVSKVDIKGRITDLSESGKYATATFNAALNYAVLLQSDANTPPVYTLINALGKSLRTIQDNAAYRSMLPSMPAKEFTTFTSDGYSLNAYIIKPSDFSASQKYPVIMWQYSGPGSQEVADKWSLDWQYFAARRGFVVVCVDGRGTGYRGRSFMDVVYKNLGYYETIDQTNVARQLAHLPYVDGSRIGIAGWSYGGYETLMCATAVNTPFAAAVSIAPVTDWRYYDTVYAERYMQTPQANEEGYRDSAPINRTRSLGCPLLIMHGTADDNVHPANSLEFAARVINDGNFCDMLLFPNMNHSIYGCDARAVVYGRMVDYFEQHLK